MHFAQPEFTPEEVNRAGKYLANAANVDPSLDQSGVDQDRVAAIINNWRAAHMYPAHLFFISLRTKAKKVDSTAFAVQRNKRLQSIRAKLIREPNMKLSQMQDIAGCRAVVKHIRHIEQLREALQASWSKHEAIAFKSYIAHPKSDGYRCLHLKYRFCASGQKQAFNGLKVEVQIRTQRQHRWATAVEVVDTFTKQALKSSAGRPEWARFLR